MDIQDLLINLVSDGTLQRIARNRLAQFGTRTRRLIGAEILPAIEVEQNEYTDDTVRYRTVIGNAGTRYSPTQMKSGVLTGQVAVRCFHTDIGSEFTSRDFDALRRYLDRGDDMQAIASVTNWLDTTVVAGLEELREVYRWQAIEKAIVNLRGDNGYKEDLAYSNPANHRAAAAAAWSTITTDPFVDIFNRVQLLSDKGFTVSRIITSRRVAGIMGNNPLVRTRTGKVTVNVGGSLAVAGGRASLAEINSALSAEGLPQMELYDLQYRTQTGTVRFISNDVMIFVCQTGRDFRLDLSELNLPDEILGDTLGYMAVGTPAGQNNPGRVIETEFFRRKPPRIEAEAWEAVMPVILEPEAIATITGIA